MSGKNNNIYALPEKLFQVQQEIYTPKRQQQTFQR